MEEHLRLYFSGEFQMFPFLQIKQGNKLLRKAYEEYFIDRFKLLLNQISSFALNLLPRKRQILRI